MGVRARLIELWKRKANFSKSEDIYFNGEDNKYPMEIERVILNSPTAFRAFDIMTKFIAGSRITKDVRFEKHRTLYDEVKRVSSDLSMQAGSFVHIQYGLSSSEGRIIPIGVKVLDYNNCRKSKEDDDENKGKIYYENYDEEEDGFLGFMGTVSANKKTWFYPFNDNQNVIESQVRSDSKSLLKDNPDATLEDMLNQYRGQVHYINLTPSYVYAISKFNSVYNDCDTEYRMSLYSNTVTRNGFMGKIAVLTNSLEIEDGAAIDNDLKKWLGSENAGNLYHIEFEGVENLENAMKIINVESNYDDDMFVNTSKRIRENILGVANNLPTPLVFASDGALFGGTDEKYIQMKLFYQEQTEGERTKIEQEFKKIGFDFKIIELVKKEETKTMNDANRDNTSGL